MELILLIKNSKNKINGKNNSKIIKVKITVQIDNDREIDNVEIVVPLKYLSNFWRILETPLINCEVANCIIVYADVTNQGAIFTITEIKLYIPVVNL